MQLSMHFKELKPQHNNTATPFGIIVDMEYCQSIRCLSLVMIAIQLRTINFEFVSVQKSALEILVKMLHSAGKLI